MDSGKEPTVLQLQSLVRKNEELEISLVRVPVPVPKADEVLVRIDATPLNPSDLGHPGMRELIPRLASSWGAPTTTV